MCDIKKLESIQNVKTCLPNFSVIKMWYSHYE